MDEQWLPIRQIPTFYVSNKGRVRNGITNRFNIPSLDKYGYERLSIRKLNLKVHRLVAEAFIPNTNNLPIVDHIDRNRTNNNVENLRWVNHQQSTFNRDVNGYDQRKGKGSYRARIQANGRRTTLGFYNTEADARDAYLKAKAVLHVIDSPKTVVNIAKIVVNVTLKPSN